jgi:hypothetical protein
MNYASGKHAWFICDECGMRYPYRERRKTSYGTFVCPVDFDGEFDLHNHPQNSSPPITADAEALEDARPDVALDAPDTAWDPSMTIRVATTTS